MQTDGNFVIRDSDSASKWSLAADEGAELVPGAFLHMKNDGRLVLRDPTNCQELWSTEATRTDSIEYRTDKVADDDVARYDLEEYSGSTPAIFAQMQSFNGADTSQIRVTSVNADSFLAFVEEEKSLDNEDGHVAEDFGYLAMNEGPINDIDGNLIGEVFSVFKNQLVYYAWHTVSFLEGSYNNPVVIAMMNSQNGLDPCTVRIQNVGSGSIKFRIEEWDYLDGKHSAPETIKFLVLEAGHHRIESGGQTIGLVAKKSYLDHNWHPVCGLEAKLDFLEVPGVLSQTMSAKGSSPVVTRQKDITNNSVNIRLQEEESQDGDHSFETVGVVVFGAAPVNEVGSARSRF